MSAGSEQLDTTQGLKPGEIGPYLGRPASSVARLIDEWPYATITGGLGPGEPEYPEMGDHGE